MAVLDAVAEDIDFLIISHKQNSGNLIAQSAIWLGEITVFFKGFLRECIEKDGGTGDHSHSILFQKLAEILFIYAQLLEDFIEKPASDLRIAVYRNCG